MANENLKDQVTATLAAEARAVAHMQGESMRTQLAVDAALVDVQSQVDMLKTSSDAVNAAVDVAETK